MKLTSSAFTHEGPIPSQYTCDGANISPPLSWTEAPQGTVSFVLIVEDPDAPVSTWDHWALFNIPSKIDGLAENLKSVPVGATTARNSWGKNEYGGPCPPKGTHRYFFKLTAIDSVLSLSNTATKKYIESSMKSHILGEATLMGTYIRH
jgi:Raf kinase inhibitor-like YbhB/YbcL family protein